VPRHTEWGRGPAATHRSADDEQVAVVRGLCDEAGTYRTVNDGQLDFEIGWLAAQGLVEGAPDDRRPGFGEPSGVKAVYIRAVLENPHSTQR
jgi:hypothetical protein